MKKPLKSTLISVGAVLIVCVLLAGLTIAKLIHPNELFIGKYEVIGVDVSSYQGKINWKALASQDISFAYIKATGGSSWTDDRFEYNFSEARKAGLKTGSYHLFSFDSSGASQAEHFISVVPTADDALPPAIDLEFYGKYFDAHPDKDKVLTELKELAHALENHYNVKPVIYTTGKAYDAYIKDTEFADYSTWTRQVYVPFAKADKWDFWQYSDTNKLDGYDGDEQYIDMNVFNGTEEDFEKYCNASTQKK